MAIVRVQGSAAALFGHPNTNLDDRVAVHNAVEKNVLQWPCLLFLQKWYLMHVFKC